ncbi:MAG: hemagglutinin repeat-containing protein, partial [Proteobacteria bacterium]|nr:hemagglutinin repeat-containing protein [Pseudomonadota bacterium]
HTEIFGQSANYILANPNGISINGGGFINTPKATLTTGTPQFSGGAFQGLDVRGGDILVEGAGINTNNIDAFELVTRAAQINADIYAKRLDIITGQNRHNPVSGTTTPLVPDGSVVPTVSIDSAALGGMYAGRITLVGTEAGVGVNIQGIVQATEHLEMTADGKIQIKNAASSAQTLALTSTNDSVEVSGTVKAVGTATLTGQTVTVAKLDPADTPKVNAGNVVINAGTLDNQALIAGDSTVAIAATNINNTGTIYSSDTATLRVANTLLNNRGIILSKNDMTLEGTTAGLKMGTLQNDSGSIESLDGSLTFRATSFHNNNSQFTLVEGADILKMDEGCMWWYNDQAGQATRLFNQYIGPTPASGIGGNIMFIYPLQMDAIGLAADKHAYTRAEIQAAIAQTDAELAINPNYLNASQKGQLSSIRSYANNPRYVYFGRTIGRTDGFALRATVTRDTATGHDLGGTIAAQNNILIEAGDAKNTVSNITTATGDITINANTFENVGSGIYERTTIKYGRGIFHSHESPNYIPTGGGTEVYLTPIDYAYGTIDAGNKVTISSGAVANGVTERNGIIVAPDPATQQQKVTDVTALTSVIPVNGLFRENTNPAHNYAIETDPSLTNLDTFYGSDYALTRMGFNPNDEANKRLGDAFYETQLVRNQILELTGRRFFEDGIATDTAQMVALMDNAIQARTDLNLSVGLALSAEQVAALGADIVWFERQTVNGQEVLVPVVYLGSNSLNRIAQGGSVIIGKDTLIEASGEVFNQGLMVAANDIEINADTIFNRQGTISGQNVGLTATDSVRVMGGFIRGDSVALTAGNDVVIASDTVEFKDTDTTATQVAMAGKVEAANGLTIEAGRDIGILGAEVTAGGDATLKAGGNVAISTVETKTQSATSGSGYNSHTDTTTNRRSDINTGGALTVEAGQDVAVHGSQIEADGNVDIKAGGNVSVTAATDKTDFYSHNSGGGGGFFGGKKSTTIDVKEQRNVASTIKSGGSVTAEAGASGAGSLLLQGSQIKATQNVTLKAEGDIQVAPNQIENYAKYESTSTGFMGAKSMTLDESSTTTNVRPEIEAGEKVVLNAKNDVVLQSARIKSGDTTEIIAEEGKVAMLVTKDKKYERKMDTDMGFLTWSSSDVGAIDETVIHTLIESGGALTITTPEGVIVEFKESTGDVRKDAELLSNVEGLKWMEDLLERDDVDWVAVQEIHDSWDKSDGGLGAGGMLIIALIASAVTAGAASGLALAATGLEFVTINGVSTLAVAGSNGAILASSMEMAMYTAISAGVTSLSAQISVSLVDAAAGGDLGNNLSGIASIDGLRSLAATMIMAGTLSTYAGDFAKMGAPGEIMAKTTVKTLTSTIVGGEDLEQSFRTALGSTFASYAKGEITSNQLNDTVNLILTGATGAAGSAIAGGDPMQGALSAIVAELADQIKAPDLTEEQKAEAKPYAEASKAVYGDGDKLPENLEEVDLAAKGIKSEIMETTSSGLQSRLYQNKGSSG